MTIETNKKEKSSREYLLDFFVQVEKNREIKILLFTTVKQVEMHVLELFNKMKGIIKNVADIIQRR